MCLTEPPIFNSTSFDADYNGPWPHPGLRTGSVRFAFQDFVFLFGGSSNGTTIYMDMWFWNGITTQWSYVNGPQGPVEASSAPTRIVATLREFSPLNRPSPSKNAAFTYEPSLAFPELFYMFGGELNGTIGSEYVALPRGAISDAPKFVSNLSMTFSV